MNEYCKTCPYAAVRIELDKYVDCGFLDAKEKKESND